MQVDECHQLMPGWNCLMKCTNTNRTQTTLGASRLEDLCVRHINRGRQKSPMAKCGATSYSQSGYRSVDARTGHPHSDTGARCSKMWVAEKACRRMEGRRGPVVCGPALSIKIWMREPPYTYQIQLEPPGSKAELIRNLVLTQERFDAQELPHYELAQHELGQRRTWSAPWVEHPEQNGVRTKSLKLAAQARGCDTHYTAIRRGAESHCGMHMWLQAGIAAVPRRNWVQYRRAGELNKG
ncbi:hypothetical protein C8R43DRAFT_963381 [Mycena crocata]|nr:hypothetical protein C8R43DRAFT_963381 [Mycena crocata]